MAAFLSAIETSTLWFTFTFSLYREAIFASLSRAAMTCSCFVFGSKAISSNLATMASGVALMPSAAALLSLSISAITEGLCANPDAAFPMLFAWIGFPCRASMYASFCVFPASIAVAKIVLSAGRDPFFAPGCSGCFVNLPIFLQSKNRPKERPIKCLLNFYGYILTYLTKAVNPTPSKFQRSVNPMGGNLTERGSYLKSISYKGNPIALLYK